ncbi:MAG: redoxin family protein [Planctomycetota bacterium]
MKTQLKFLAALGLSAAVLSATAALAPLGDEAQAKVGEAAPSFTLTDLDGNEHSLADFKGKIIVLEWTNPGCPYIVGCYGKGVVGNTLEKMKQMGDDLVYLGINSTGNMAEDDVIKMNAKFLEENKVDIPVLVDHDGTVGRMYGARTTPHTFVIDRDGVLRYQGAYTDDPRGKKGDEAMNYVLNAIEQIENGETVSPDYVKPWGCSVKYTGKAAGKGRGYGRE